MGFFKEWICAVASAIIFASLCEILLPSGYMKKYVSLILGIILSITMVKPIEKISLNNWSDKLFEFERNNAYITQEVLEENEKEEVIKIYTSKLEAAVKRKLCEKVNADIRVDLETETYEKERFGEINEVLVTVIQDDSFKDYRSTIEEILNKEFGVSNEKVKIKFKNSF